MMHLFLMWADDRSCKIAGALRDEIRSVFEQKVVPFYSQDDVPKGLAWFDAIVAQLNRSDIGIACLTPESLQSPWLHMEVGVLYQVFSSAKRSAKKDFKILPFLFEIDNEQFSKHPLSHFQGTFATKHDTRILFRTINNSLAELDDEPLPEMLLNQRFDESWIRIERQLSQLASAHVPVYSAYRHTLELAKSLGQAVHVITVSPVLASNVCLQKLVDHAVDEMTIRVKQFTERDPVLRLSVANFVCYLRNLCTEKNISIKVFSILNDQDGSPPPIQLNSIDFPFKSANCTTIVSSLDQAEQLIKMPRNQFCHWDWRLMTQKNYHAEFGKRDDDEHWFCLVSRDEKPEILAWSAGRSHELIASVKTEKIKMHVEVWDKVYDYAVPMPALPTTENDVEDTRAALTKPLRIQVTEPELIAIPGGKFQMGSPVDEPGRFVDENLHSVDIPYDFAIGLFPVTFDQYDEFVQAKSRSRRRPDDKTGERGRRPVVNVSWNEAMAYTAWLSEKTGKEYGLPTEAEWEYAARAGQLDSSGSLGDGDDTSSVHFANKQDGPLAVGQLPANPWGLHDCLGNIWEWTCSCYDENYGGAETRCAALQDPGPRVARGGAWNSPRRELRYAMRKPLRRHHTSAEVGFRVVCRKGTAKIHGND
jgi:formylglycine-generating enzyme required for sulfatase activity